VTKSGADIRQGKAGVGTQGANLIVHYSVADIFDKAPEPIETISSVASVNQWSEAPENFIEFSSDSSTSDRLLVMGCGVTV